MSEQIDTIFMLDKAIRLEQEYHNSLIKYHNLVQTEEPMIVGVTPIKSACLIERKEGN